MSPAAGRDDTEQPRRSHSFPCLVWGQGESTEFLLLLGYAYLYRKHNYLFGTFSLLLKKPPHCYFYSCFKRGQNWSLQAETLEVWIAACQGPVWEDCTESTGGRGEWKEKEWEEILDLQTYCKDRRTSKKIFKNETKKKLSTLRKIKWPLIAPETFPRTHTGD